MDLDQLWLQDSSSTPGNSSSLQEVSKEKDAGWWELVSFSWFNTVINRGYFRTLRIDDVFALLPKDMSFTSYSLLLSIR
jgi:hypothetical protein